MVRRDRRHHSRIRDANRGADVARAKVVALHSFNDDEALMWLSDHVDGRVEMSLSDLAQQFGWPQVTLRRRLAAWVEGGHIAQFAGGRGKVILAPTRSSREVATRGHCRHDTGLHRFDGHFDDAGSNDPGLRVPLRW